MSRPTAVECQGSRAVTAAQSWAVSRALFASHPREKRMSSMRGRRRTCSASVPSPRSSPLWPMAPPTRTPSSSPAAAPRAKTTTTTTTITTITTTTTTTKRGREASSECRVLRGQNWGSVLHPLDSTLVTSSSDPGHPQSPRVRRQLDMDQGRVMTLTPKGKARSSLQSTRPGLSWTS